MTMPDLWDVLAVIGFLLLAAGVAMIYVPAAFIVAGLLLLIAAIRASQRTSGE